MPQSDLAFHRSRRQQCLAMALASPLVEARRVHEELARLHSARIASLLNDEPRLFPRPVA
ncbi:hypothetical protein GG804_23410 [Sphingomonas histidinilytica]|jgi:hypothetical protein|uniref:hypothetical protein n=1 Tax=Rhizorhabdus histidinilytica TaxID=439228 RepID=UPI0009A7F73F|nr:hypothetical protein [Rhizorhabdus histidinilytica]MBO9379725.1 hypothetical protein [Rhizorhabdus histidinilytica]QEH80348.1 hypothetical protein EIK56_20375 [Sphingomonas sp. C8-2]